MSDLDDDIIAIAKEQIAKLREASASDFLLSLDDARKLDVYFGLSAKIKKQQAAEDDLDGKSEEELDRMLRNEQT